MEGMETKQSKGRKRAKCLFTSFPPNWELLKTVWMKNFSLHNRTMTEENHKHDTPQSWK